MTTGSEFTIGILEFGECEPTDPKKIIDQSVLVAREAEILGYRRYWLAEHHTRRSAWASAEIVIAAVASATRKIAVGSGGTLLNYHSTLDIVNSYSLLGRMFPGRIELGLGRGIPVCNAIQLRESLGKKERATEAEYESRVRELLRYLTVHDQSAPDESIHCPVPALHNPVPVWILGTGSLSARIASMCGLPFALSAFHSRESNFEALHAYINGYQATALHPAPVCLLAVAGICAETRFAAGELLAKRLNRNVFPTIVGTAEDWLKSLNRLRDRHGIADFLILDLASDLQDRLRTLRLLSELLQAR